MNNDFAIESFIDYCDSMIITTEAINVKKIKKNVWFTSKTAIDNLETFFKNLVYNANYFKNAQLPKQMNSDLELLLQNLEPRRGAAIKSIQQAILMTKLFITKQDKEDFLKVKHAYSDLELSIDDAKSTLSDVMESKEYKRVMNKDYDFSEVTDIPLSKIVTKMKETQNNITKYKGYLEKVENNLKHTENKKIKELFHELYSSILRIYREQTKLLNIYFASAKASLKGVQNNVKDALSKSDRVSRDYDNMTKSLTIPKHVTLSDKDYNRMKELDKLILECDNKLDKFDEYTKLRREVCSILKVSENNVLVYRIRSGNRVRFSITEDKGIKIKLLDNMQLFHSSKNHRLGKLIPRYFFKHTDEDGGRRLWKTPRVYMAIANGIGREGGKFDGEDKSLGCRSFLYTPSTNITTVYKDPEMRVTGIAVYIEDTKPIPVKRVK